MLPKVVIVGRPNVGKSSLLNMLAGRRVSIVDPTAGVTRDRVSVHAELPPERRGGDSRWVELIDTGGYGVKDVQNLTGEIEQQIANGIAEADLILFVVDAHTGVVPLDNAVAEVLRESGATGKAGKPVVLVANKVDAEKYEPGAYEAASLGFDDMVLVSAETGHMKWDLYEALYRHIDFDKFEADAAARGESLVAPDPGMRLAIVGKRNAGKSTFVNALAEAQRVIVSEQEGTTRDSVDVRFEADGQVFTAIDTAGVRKRKSVKEDIDYYSHHRSLRSVRRADVCLFLIDASVPVSQVDKQLGNEIQKHYRPTVLVVNKWDLAEDEHTQEEYVEYLERELKGFSYAPIVFTTAMNSEGVRDALAMAMNLYEQAGHRVTTGEMNRVVEAIMAERGPSSKGGKRAKVFYATQLDVYPPTIALFVNAPELFEGTYERFLLNRFRDVLPYSEVPIKLLFRGRKQMPEDEK